MEGAPSFPLHEAAREGKTLTVRGLLEQNAGLANKKDEDGRTPLFWALSSGNTEVASEILKKGKDLRSFDIDETDEAGWTVLHIAASTGNLQAIKELIMPLEPAVNAQTNSGSTPLHFAVSKGHVEVIKYLLDNGASPRLKDKQEQNALHRAASVGNLPIVQLLINAKCPLNATDRTSWTSLHHALAEGHGDVAIAIVKAGGDLDRADNDGRTPYDVTCTDGIKKYVQEQLALSSNA
jgi:26S proteasome non-ATPase regulatory subunit 10